MTEGQEKQLHRNAERAAGLKTSIAELEESLFDKLYPHKARSTKRKSQEASTMDDAPWDEGEDDFFDRTKNSNSSQSSGGDGAESETSLIAKWKSFFEAQRIRRSVTLPKTKSHLNALREKIANLQGQGDEDVFFLKNDLTLAEEKMTRVENDIKDCDYSMNDVEKLLRIVNPRLQWDRKSGCIGEGGPRADASSSDLHGTMPPPALPREEAMPLPFQPDQEKERIEPIIMEPPPSPSRKSGDETRTFEMPAPKRKRVVGPTMPPPSAPASSADSSTEKPERPNQLVRPVAGTLSCLSSMSKKDWATDVDGVARSETKPAGPTNLRSNTKEDVWQAPKDQDGSGRTKLNDKFAGRY